MSQATALKSVSRDVYITHVNCKGEKSIQCHSVWDLDRFLAARTQECVKLNAEQKSGEPRFAAILPATREEYLASRKK